jgi:protein arginine kinase activator
MKFGRCFFCNKLAPIAFHVTEIEKNSVESVDLCPKCGHEYMKSLYTPQEPVVPQGANVTQINTAQDLISFVASLMSSKKPIPPPSEPCPGCGMTLELFEKGGRLGCPTCYDHFQLLMEKVVFPYHKANEHVGKRPKHAPERELAQNPIEKMKLLKLRLASAVELEQYERAAELKKEIEQLTELLPSVSEDQ